MLDEYICRLVSHGNGVYEYEPIGTELVRCKDCKHKDTDKCPMADICNWEWVTWSNPDDFCSRAERKDEQNDYHIDNDGTYEGGK